MDAPTAPHSTTVGAQAHDGDDTVLPVAEERHLRGGLGMGAEPSVQDGGRTAVGVVLIEEASVRGAGEEVFVGDSAVEIEATQVVATDLV